MDLKDLIHKSVKESLHKSGKLPEEKTSTNINTNDSNKNLQASNSPTIKETPKKKSNLLKEALHLIPKTFQLKTESLSEDTKKHHLLLYRQYVDTFNKISSGLDAVNRQEASANYSEYRSLKIDETYNLNAVKLHELYFYNIADPNSEISTDALPYMRLARDFGTFENFQFDFMACCDAAREGWAVTVYEPYRDVYMNVAIDSHNVNIPVGTIPVIVMDVWAHSYYKDYDSNKEDYVVAMMRELNWDVVEARMALAEKADLGALYMVQPAYNVQPERMLNNAEEAPIQDVERPGQVATGTGEPPTTPPSPATTPPDYPRRGQ